MIKKISIYFLTPPLIIASTGSAVLAENTSAFYDIANVSAHDTLSLRTQAGGRSQLIATIPSNARFLNTTGKAEKRGKSTWVEIKYRQHTGWVNKHYLTPSTNEQFTPLACLGTEPFWSLDVESKKIIVRDIDENETTYALSNVSISNNHTNRWMLQGTTQGTNKLAITLWKTNSCSDGMSDRSYEYEIIYNTPTEGVFSGCCNVIN